MNNGNMLDNRSMDYLLEKTLKEISPDLHTRYKDTVFATQNILSRYKLLFPEYTDHTEFHTLTIIDSCNRLIGEEQIKKLNADEIYILLEACFFHDIGMGISEKDFLEFKDHFDEDEFFKNNPNATRADFIRVYHNEFSALFLDKYCDLFDIPSKEHLFAIKQTVRGHRKTDLFDEKEYPAEYELPNGNKACLPYLAALIRLSDEVDVVATRNPLVLYDIDVLTDEVQVRENKKLYAVKSMIMSEEAFDSFYETDEKEIEESILQMVDKMQNTLDYCRKVVDERTEFVISQKRINLYRMSD